MQDLQVGKVLLLYGNEEDTDPWIYLVIEKDVQKKVIRLLHIHSYMTVEGGVGEGRITEEKYDYMTRRNDGNGYVELT